MERLIVIGFSHDKADMFVSSPNGRQLNRLWVSLLPVVVYLAVFIKVIICLQLSS